MYGCCRAVKWDLKVPYASGVMSFPELIRLMPITIVHVSHHKSLMERSSIPSACPSQRDPIGKDPAVNSARYFLRRNQPQEGAFSVHGCKL